MGMKENIFLQRRRKWRRKRGKYVEKENMFFAVEKKNREGKGRQCLEKEQHIKFQVVHKSDALFDFTKLPMCLR